MKILTKHISCERKCKFDRRKCNSDQWWNNDKCRCECKKHHVCEKAYVWNPATCNCKNGKYLARIMDDSAITRDEIIDLYEEDTDADADEEARSNEEAKSNYEANAYDETYFNEKKATCKMQNFYVLLAFLLITIALLIAISIYRSLIKYWAKQLLPLHNTNAELREVLY